MLDGFGKIKAWQHADKLAVAVYQVTKAFPKEEIYGLTSQMRRCAVSVPANIVEGSQRKYLKEYSQFLYTARSSLGELEYYLHLAFQLGYLPDVEYRRLDELRAETGKTLHGLIKWVDTQLEDGMTTKADLKSEA